MSTKTLCVGGAAHGMYYRADYAPSIAHMRGCKYRLVLVRVDTASNGQPICHRVLVHEDVPLKHIRAILPEAYQ